jgi:hypothetical protein
MVAVILTTAILALRSPLLTSRRNAVIGIGGIAASAGALPAAAISFDPIGAYGKMIPEVKGPLKSANGKPNTGIALLRDCFDGVLPSEGLLAWYEEHLTPDFVAEFAGGTVTLDKESYLGVTADILKSFPDFVYTRSGPIAFADNPKIVTWTAVVKGTHSGAPYSPLPGVPPVASKSPPVACENDPEKVTAYFESDTKPLLSRIKKLKVQALSGGRGFSGPVGFYLQAGGDPSKLPSQ